MGNVVKTLKGNSINYNSVIKFSNEEQMYTFYRKLTNKFINKEVEKYQFSSDVNCKEDFYQIADLKLLEVCKKLFGKGLKVGQVISYVKIAIHGAFINANSIKNVNDRKLMGKINKIKENDLVLGKRISNIKISRKLSVDVSEIDFVSNIAGNKVSLDYETENEDGDSISLYQSIPNYEYGYMEFEFDDLAQKIEDIYFRRIKKPKTFELRKITLRQMFYEIKSCEPSDNDKILEELIKVGYCDESFNKNRISEIRKEIKEWLESEEVKELLK